MRKGERERDRERVLWKVDLQGSTTLKGKRKSTARKKANNDKIQGVKCLFFLFVNEERKKEEKKRGKTKIRKECAFILA